MSPGRKRPTGGLVAALVVVLLVGRTPVRADQPAAGDASKEKETSRKSARSAAPRRSPGTPSGNAPSGAPRAPVYTNEDLARFARPEDRTVDPQLMKESQEKQESFAQDAQKRQAQIPASNAFRAKLRGDAEDRVRVAEERLEALRRQALADANPLVPQRKLGPEEEKELQGMSRDERLKKTQEQITEAEGELTAARASLQEILRQLSAAPAP